MTDVPTAPDSPVERTLVARGWLDLDLVERLGPGVSERNRQAALLAAEERAREWYRAPVSDHVPESRMAMYESRANVVRYKRVVDFLSEGDRVYEVGLGYGFLAALMVREGRLARYRGVDLVPAFAERTTQTLQRNGFDDIADASTKDLYELTSADTKAIDANLLVCCEVIEHVPDPELALKTLAAALPEGADLLFSIPLVGRLETIWGHGQVFGAARIQQLLAAAGLVPHHVEVLHDTWALVLASAGTAPSPRAAAVLEATEPVDPARLVTPAFREMSNHEVARLPRAESAWTKRVGDPLVTSLGPDTDPDVDPEDAAHDGVRVTARAERITSGPGKGWAACAGVAFAAPEGTKGVRLELSVPEREDISALHVEFRRDGERIGLWKWKPGEGTMKQANPTFLVVPGRDGVHLRRVPGSTSVGADTVEVFATAREDQPIDFSILRWAWVS